VNKLGLYEPIQTHYVIKFNWDYFTFRKMVSTKEDAVDFQKLEKELYDALEEDARYDRENSAKFRAVNQKVATYDEFRFGVHFMNL
jgi:hypothetical protein